MGLFYNFASFRSNADKRVASPVWHTIVRHRAMPLACHVFSVIYLPFQISIPEAVKRENAACLESVFPSC